MSVYLIACGSGIRLKVSNSKCVIPGKNSERPERAPGQVCIFFLYGECHICADCVPAATEQGPPSCKVALGGED